MRSSFLQFSPPLIGDKEVAEVVATLQSDWITTGPKVKSFEINFAAYLGAPDAVAVNSCTAALHVGLTVCGVGAGDVVVTTPMTFCSTVNVIEQIGARPLLVDVERDTLNIDPAQIEHIVRAGSRGVTEGKVSAIMAVHLYGHPCDLDSLEAISDCENLALIEDCAHALPAEYKGRSVGAAVTTDAECHRRVAAFSFYATKNLTTAEGGMLTGSTSVIDRARIWALHGMSRDAYRRYDSSGSWQYDVVVPGFKYNMSDINAALGIHQLERLPELQARREAIAAQYDEAFADVEQVEVPSVRPEVSHARHIYALRLRLDRLRIDRAEFIEQLRRLNIGTSVHFIPVHMHRYYRQKYGFRPQDFPVAFGEYLRLVSLPLYPRMTHEDVCDVVDAVTRVVRNNRRRHCS